MTKLQEVLTLKEIDQLHSSILQFSHNTLTIKKICATVLVAITTIVLQITSFKLNIAVYIACIITITIFWIIDANSYYYQRKLRIRMNYLVNELNQENLIIGFGMPLKSLKEKPSWIKSLFNISQFFYILTFIIIIIVLLCDTWNLY